MQVARKNHTLVALPDGRVAAFGGNQTGQLGISDTNVNAPEVWDPFTPTGSWVTWKNPFDVTTLAHLYRPYHSTALLLADARVLVAGGEDEFLNWTNSPAFPQRRAQIFTPPYGNSDSWQSSRPSITSTPGPLRYGETFSIDVSTSGSRQVSKLTMISLGATTHALNERQNVVFLTTSPSLPQNAGTLTVSAPASTKIAPPGYYMLFAVDDQGVPSVAKIVLLKDFDLIIPAISSITGTWSTTPQASEYALGDNQYIGSYLTASLVSGSYVAETIADTNIDSSLFGTRNIRLSVQVKASTHPVTATAYLYNWTTSAYDEIDHQTILVSETEQDRIYVSPNSTATQNPYVRSSDGLVRAKYKLIKTTSFQAYLDILEIGVRS